MCMDSVAKRFLYSQHVRAFALPAHGVGGLTFSIRGLLAAPLGIQHLEILQASYLDPEQFELDIP